MGSLPLGAAGLWAIDLAVAQFIEGAPRREIASVLAAAGGGTSSAPATGTHVVPIIGPIAKDPWIAMFGGTCCLDAQAELQAAASSGEVDSIMLLIDSPGGQVAGIEELADEVRAAARIKPVTAHIDDLGASAAYWVASQATEITANASAQVGSVGAIAQITDVSKALEKAGVKVHTIRSGDKKALGADPEVTPEALEYVKDRIEVIAGRFLDYVQEGRDLSNKTRKDISDARLMGADEALKLGLIDGIESRNSAYGTFRAKVEARNASTRRRMQVMAETRDLRIADRLARSRYRVAPGE